MRRPASLVCCLTKSQPTEPSGLSFPVFGPTPGNQGIITIKNSITIRQVAEPTIIKVPHLQASSWSRPVRTCSLPFCSCKGLEMFGEWSWFEPSMLARWFEYRQGDHANSCICLLQENQDLWNHQLFQTSAIQRIRM